MATELNPSARACVSPRRATSSSSSTSTSPSAVTRSSISKTSAYSISGRSMSRAKRSGRVWYPILRTSANPAVVTKRVGSPCRSSSALVATVVPILTVSIWSSGIGSFGARSKRSLMPCTAASEYWRGLSERSLWVTNDPSGSRPTMSVKVPPRSIQKFQPLFIDSGHLYRPHVTDVTRLLNRNRWYTKLRFLGDTRVAPTQWGVLRLWATCTR